MPQYQGVWSLQQQMQALTSGQWATDPLFDYTTLLLQADNAANSAQNNTFLDSSTNAFAITRNGNTTQGTFSPFSLQPGAWANYFNGSTDYLTTPDAASMELGSGNFCVECWYYTTVNNVWQGIITKRADNQGAPILLIQQNSDIKVYMSTAAGNFSVASGVIIGNAPTNQWIHVAVYRVGTVIYGAVNGVVTVVNASTSATLYDNTSAWYIGNDVGATPGYFYGYVSNARIVVGSAVYGSSNFIPPTSPLTAITNTQLLTCQANRFIDANTQTTAKTITANGTPSVQPFSPFAPQYQWTSDVIGGSGYFDGTGDYLQSSGDFFSGQGTARTFQCWIYVVSMPGAGSSQGIFSGANSGGNLSFRFASDGTLNLDNTGTANIAASSAGAIKAGQWTHVAVTRTTGNLYTLYVNGSSVGSGTNSTSMGSSTYIGSLTTGSTLNGYMAGVRVTNTVETISVPTAPLTAISGTALLLNFTNAGILDGTMKNNLETVGNAQVSTSVVKYGSGSLYFDGSGDWLVARDNAYLNLGSSDFTIEFWMYVIANPAAAAGILCKSVYASNAGWTIIYYPGYIAFLPNGSGPIAVQSAASSISTGVWTHVAITRQGTVGKAFINGIQSGSSGTISNFTDSSNVLGVGALDTTLGWNGTYPFNGYLDDLRITKGIARYTQNFIPPSVALPRQ